MRFGWAARKSRAPNSGFVRPAYELAGLHSSSPARFVIGIVSPASGRGERAYGRDRPRIVRHLPRGSGRAGWIRSAFLTARVVCLQRQVDPGDSAGRVRLVDREPHGVADSDAVRAGAGTGQRHVDPDRPGARRKARRRSQGQPAETCSGAEQDHHATGQRDTTTRHSRLRPGDGSAVRRRSSAGSWLRMRCCSSRSSRFGSIPSSSVSARRASW